MQSSKVDRVTIELSPAMPGLPPVCVEWAGNAKKMVQATGGRGLPFWLLHYKQRGIPVEDVRHRQIYTGPRGGRYWVTEKGRHQYEPASGVFTAPTPLRKASAALIMRPGSRGGKVYHTRTGRLRYGTDGARGPAGRFPSAPSREVTFETFELGNLKQLKLQIDQWPDDHVEAFHGEDFSRRDVGMMAMRAAKTGHYSLSVAWVGGKPVGVYALDTRPFSNVDAWVSSLPDQGDPATPHWQTLYAFATARRGVASRLLARAVAECGGKHRGMLLHASPNAAPFYEHEGMHATRNNASLFYLTAEEIPAWLTSKNQ